MPGATQLVHTFLPCGRLSAPPACAEASDSACNVARLFLRMARSLIAKRAVQRYVGRRRHRSGAKDVNFFELPCCSEHGHLQSNFDAVEKRICHGNFELGSAARARDAELGQLGIELSYLRHRVEHACGNMPTGIAAPIEPGAETCWDEMEALQKQLSTQKASIEAARKQRLEVDRQAAEYRMLLKAQRDIREQNLVDLRKQLQPRDGNNSEKCIASPVIDGLSDLLERRCSQLHGPANLFLKRYGYAELSCLPQSGGDGGISQYMAWLTALTARLGQLSLQIETAQTSAVL